MSHRSFPQLLRILAILLSAALLGGTAAAQTDISGDVYDGNGGPLLAGQIYHATSTVNVPAGETLTIQQGAIVKFYAGFYRLDVRGSLNVTGASGDPAYITSILDDSVGGDSAGDGATIGAPGDWHGVFLRATSGPSSLDYLEIRFAGKSSWAGLHGSGANFSLTNSTIRDGLAEGIELGSAASSPTIAYNSIVDNGAVAITGVRLDHVPGIASNSASGNAGGDYMYVSSSSLTGDVTVSTENCLNGALVIGGGSTIGSGLTLTLNPGVVLKWTVGIYRLDVQGTLDINGTAAEPVVLTSFPDDDWAGDTNGDGPSDGVPGDWQGIYLRSGASATTIDHAVIRYPGRSGWAGIHSSGASFTMTSSTIRDGLAEGVDLASAVGSPSISNCSFHDNVDVAVRGVRLEQVPGFLDNTASGNGVGDYMYVSVPSPTGDVTISKENCLNGALVMGAGCSIAAVDTLRLNRGVVLKWIVGTIRLDVHGTLDVRGANLQPVVLTSIADDDWAGDTNKDGPSSGTAGDWQGIQLRTTADATTIDRAIIRYAGRTSQGAIASYGADFTLTNTRIENCLVEGIDLTGYAASPTISRCTIKDNGGVAINGVRMDHVPGIYDNEASGNTLGDYMFLTVPSPSGDVTVLKRNCLNGALVLSAGCAVPSGATLTLRPGIVLKFAPGYVRLEVYGSLMCEGTGLEPVVATCLPDDEWAGDTNVDGAATTGVAGDWYGVRIRASADASSLENLLVRFGGKSSLAALDIASSLATLRAVRCEHAAAEGFRISALSGDAVNLVAFDCGQVGISLEGGTFDLVHATAAGNATYGIESGALHTGRAVNSIAWNNTVANFNGFAAGELLNCDGSPTHAGSDGCIDQDPLFVDDSPGVGDLRIQLASPCLDTADYASGYAVEKDHGEYSRLLDPNLTGTALPDMGAHEHALWSLSFHGTPFVGRDQRFRADGPDGTATFLIGLLDGVSFADPYGFTLVGLSPVVTFATAPVGEIVFLGIPPTGALSGLEFGVQAMCIPTTNPSKGGMTNLYRGTVHALQHLDPKPWGQ